MRNFKKVIAGALALLMLALSVNVSFAAENYTDEEAVVVAKVNAAGIMQGTDKGFEPSKSLTRAEAAAIIVRMKGISESAVKATAGTTLFTDVAASHWASGYVNQASNLGIVKGVSATQFAPDREVTIAEFTTMAVRALGAGQLVDSEGTWPTNYVNFANEEKLLDNVNAIYTATATRLQAATIVANSLKAPMWTKTGVKNNGEIEWTKTSGTSLQTILTNVLKLSEEDVEIKSVSNNDHKINGNKKVNKDFNLSSVRVGLTYKSYVDEDGIYQGFWLDDEDTISFTAIAKSSKSGKIKLVVDGDEVEYTVSAGKKYTVNEIKDAGLIASLTSKNKNAFGTAYLNDDDEIIALYATEYNYYSVVDEVASSKVKMDKDVVGGVKTQISTDVKDNEYFLTKNGNGISYDDLEKGDAIEYYTVSINGGKKYVGEVITDVVEGKVTATKDNDTNQTITIDGTKYDLVAGIDKLKAGDEIEAWLNHAGNVVMYKDTKEESSSDVAIISYFKPYTDKYNWANADVKLTFMDGTTTDMLTINVLDTIEDVFDYDDAEENTSGNTYKAMTKAATPVAVPTITFAQVMEKATGVASYSAAAVLGKAVCYEVSGNEVTFKALSTGKDEEFYTVDASEKLNVGKKTATITNVKDHAASPVTYSNVYVTENTQFIKVKADGTYGLKIEVIEYSDLGDETVFNGDSYVVDYDEDEKEVKAVVFGLNSTVSKSAESNLAFIAEIREAAKVDNKKASEVDVIYLNGTKETLKAIDGTTNNYNTFLGKEYALVDLSVKDGEITDFNVMGTSASDDELISVYDGVNGQSPAGATTIASYVDSKYELTLASGNAIKTISDDALILKANGDYNTFTVKSVSDLQEYADSTTDYCGVMYSLAYWDKAEKDKEIILVVYKTIDKKVVDTVSAATITSGVLTAAATVANTTKTATGLTVTYKANTGFYFDDVTVADVVDSDVATDTYAGSVDITTVDNYHDTLVVKYAK